MTPAVVEGGGSRVFVFLLGVHSQSPSEIGHRQNVAPKIADSFHIARGVRNLGQFRRTHNLLYHLDRDGKLLLREFEDNQLLRACNFLSCNCHMHLP